jgi:hypothetical protein
MPDKIALERIRHAYANMEDEELLNVAKTDGMKLYADAFVLLKEEMNKRGIGIEELKKLEHEIILRASLNNQRLDEDIDNNLFQQAIGFALSEKKKGTSNYDIYAGLIEMGVSDESASYMVNKIEEWTDRLHKDSKSEFQAGIGILILGVVLTYIAVSIGNFVIAASTLILIGAVRIIVGAYKNLRFKEILDQIEEEERSTFSS